MQVFEHPGPAYEQVVFCQDEITGLRSIIAIHSTALGPSLGGTRFYPYDNEAEALEDVLRLARGMTYKSAASGLHLGGGKAVVIGDPETTKSEALLRAYGRFVESLSGRYITAEDVGTTTGDMDLIREETEFVTGVNEAQGGSGDPSPATAYGIVHAMRATAQHLWDDMSLAGRRVLVVGVGKVGYALTKYLVEADADVTVADVDQDALERAAELTGVRVAPLAGAHAIECDIYSPCALGAVLNRQTIPNLQCQAVVGSANNQLADDECGEMLEARGVLYAPDYVVNAGGVINISEELAGYDRDRAYRHIESIYDNTLAVLETAKREGITPAAAADRVAERRIEEEGSRGGLRTFRNVVTRPRQS